jgi:TonB family protein
MNRSQYIPCEAFPFSEGLSRVHIGNKYGYMDKTGDIIIGLTFDEAGDFSEGLAAVKMKDKFGFINAAGEVVIEPQFDNARSFSEGLAGIEVGGKWGFITKSGKIVMEPEYDQASLFYNGLAEVQLDGQTGFINKKGKWAVPLQFDVCKKVTVSDIRKENAEEIAKVKFLEMKIEEIIEDEVPGGVEGGVLGGVVGGVLGEEDVEPVAPVRAVGEIRPPKLIRQVDPVYPEIAVNARVEGKVILDVTTDIYGRVQNVKVLRSIPLLDKAAVDAVRQWVYEPMVINGLPRPVIFTVIVPFELKDKK